MQGYTLLVGQTASTESTYEYVSPGIVRNIIRSIYVLRHHTSFQKPMSCISPCHGVYTPLEGRVRCQLLFVG